MKNSAFFIAFFTITITTTYYSVANSQTLISPTNITQVRIIGRNLTCSNPSPLPLRLALSGATASLSCDQGLTVVNATTTTTNTTGSFDITVNNAVTGTRMYTVPLYCLVYVAVPANCTITRLLGRTNVTTLRSLALLSTRIESSAGGGQTLVVTASVFVAA